MHEVRLTIPRERAAAAIAAAHAAGATRVTSTEAVVHTAAGDEPVVMISIESSTPAARRFAHDVIHAEWFDRYRCTLTTRELRAIVNAEPVAVTTVPMIEPSMDTLQDLWQLCHVTPSYAGRAIASALLMSYGVIHDDIISLILAVLILPLLSDLLGIAFGLMRGYPSLAAHAARALAVTLAVLLGAGLAWGAIDKSPVMYSGFKSIGIEFIFALVIGAAAGLASADDAGRRYLIGVAAAAQLGVFPVYLGIALSRGLPSELPVGGFLSTFVINIVTVSVTAAVCYAAVDRHRNAPETK